MKGGTVMADKIKTHTTILAAPGWYVAMFCPAGQQRG
jgi:hypothetical protein